MEAVSSLVLNGSKSDEGGLVLMAKGRRLHLAHRRFSKILIFSLYLVNVIFQYIEMREKLFGRWMGWRNHQLRPGVENDGMLRRSSVRQDRLL